MEQLNNMHVVPMKNQKLQAGILKNMHFSIHIW